jgi:hypothetical protein
MRSTMDRRDLMAQRDAIVRRIQQLDALDNIGSANSGALLPCLSCLGIFLDLRISHSCPASHSFMLLFLIFPGGLFYFRSLRASDSPMACSFNCRALYWPLF